ncbi:glycoside hydrolase family 43 protein [Glycomyces sp. TRM65418]|uniref:glycoside hydrolase family 43 protein n=1 Tax=Glycomyces sp. TRM65418 TaxID=2867006 RepID=UPI001CE5EAEF|nr:glycoside hydrolase family 43 protein [Glycomyces sp. TRM65418]MCC3763378.1 glycoside hydrolase family 43 protein [Glycomyces sp. TRM65418]QZD57369.1 glycoside hydrolase family 43 protein [Glycomyces sp. TRM65418]
MSNPSSRRAPSRLSRRGLLAGAVALPAAALLPASPASAQTAYTGYLMAHFVGEGSGGEQIYLAHSDDGLNWTDLNRGQIVLRTPLGTKGVRDPIIVRSPAGNRYWIVATDLHIGSGTSWSDAADNGSRSLVVWESTDLVNWSVPWLLNVAGSIGDAGDAWAPEAIWDAAAGDYLLYWATNSTLGGVKKHRIWYARTGDFRSITTPQVYIDRPGAQGLIDTQIIEVAGGAGGYRYYRASKEHQIVIEGADSLTGSWTRLGDLANLVGTGVEGPMWAKFNDRGEWALWLDQYATGRGYMPVLTADPASVSSYRTVSGYNVGANRKRHGFVLNLTAAEETRVLNRYRSPVFNRLQSYNFQDRYVRHSNFDVRIDPNVSPAVDSQFRLVPGLASSSAVSFESVNFPGHFLRHVNYDFVLAPRETSSQFAADATFNRVAGLADSSWSSFTSYNFPSRHLRHYGYQLRLDPVSTGQERADATFRVTT